MTSVNKNRKSRDENEMAKYNEKELADTSKFLSFVLRHKPEAIGIVLDIRVMYWTVKDGRISISSYFVPKKRASG